MKLFTTLLLTLTVAGLLFPINAFACACCAEPGTYWISTKKPEKLELDELKKIRFANASLFTTGAGEESVLGINPVGVDYLISGLFQSSAWKLNFKDEKGRAGILNLTVPTSMVSYAADVHDGREGGAGGPLLYKEWRFKSKVQTGTGFFQKGIAPATEYFLVLQGRGNNCTQAEDFTHWRLEITGKKANYAFYGEVSLGKTAAN
jgi:hypothetical protein